MHFTLFLIALATAVMLRLQLPSDRSLWHKTLTQFLLSPLLLLTTTIAILTMGMQGKMWGWSVGWIGCHLALGFLVIALASLILKSWKGWRSLQSLKQYHAIEVNGGKAYCVDTSALFAAQVGFWQPKLLLSQGLLDRLSAEQLQAVLTHEQAHLQFRDTFWFFWLGWLRQLTGVLPQTEKLWQSLLLLRELRADRWAAERVDPLLLAESLLVVVRSRQSDLSPHLTTDLNYAAFEGFGERLETRIDALLTKSQESIEVTRRSWLDWLSVGVAIAPLATIWFHC
jgi:hypothetical protein